MSQTPAMLPASIDDLQSLLERQLYVADRSLAVSVYLALRLRRPLFVEGEAGVGKTEIAKALAAALETELIRLQCYDGIDVTQALYEWNYPRQLLEIRLLEATHALDPARASKELFSEAFLIKRPLLRALEQKSGRVPVLLIGRGSTAQTMSSKDSCWSCSPISRYRFRSSAPSRLPNRQWWSDVESNPRNSRCFEAPLPLSLDPYLISRRSANRHDRLPEAPERLAKQSHCIRAGAAARGAAQGGRYFGDPGLGVGTGGARSGWSDAQVVDDTLGILVKDHDDIECCGRATRGPARPSCRSTLTFEGCSSKPTREPHRQTSVAVRSVSARGRRRRSCSGLYRRSASARCDRHPPAQ